MCVSENSSGGKCSYITTHSTIISAASVRADTARIKPKPETDSEEPRNRGAGEGEK